MAAYDSGDVSVDAQAKAWVDGVNSGAGPSGGWRLQVISLRSRRKFGRPLCDGSNGTLPEKDLTVTDANGDPVASVPSSAEGADACRDEAPVRIRRFVSGCPWALVDRVIRLLHREAPYRGIVYNGVKLDGVYRPTRTEWFRDEQAQSPGERGSLGTYTLVQYLVEIKCCDETEVLGTGGTCLESEQTTFVWDADSVEPLPVSCEQGVSYAIRAVQRDEDGLFSYQLVRTEARTKAWGPVTIECTKQQTTSEWGWRNLYGNETTGFVAKSCDGTETSVTLPPPCDSAGILTQVQLTLNNDCTFNAAVRRRESKGYTDPWTGGTSCRPETTTVYENQRVKPHVPAARPGESVHVQMRRNPDDTYSGSVSVQAAPEALTYNWTEGTECRERNVRVLQNQVSRPAVPSLSSLPKGSALEVSLSRSEDCLWDARFAVTAPPSPFEMDWTQGSLCRPDEVSVHQGVPVAPDASEFLPKEAGDTVSGSVQRNSDCTYDWRRETRKAAPPIPADDRSWEQGTACRREIVTVYQNEVSRPEVPAPSGGSEVAASLRRNDDCTWDGQITVREPAQPDDMHWIEGSMCRVVDAHHLVNQLDYVVPAPGAGEAVNASVSKNSDCTYDVNYKIQKPFTGESPTWVDGTVCQARHHTLWVDLGERPAIARAGRGQVVQASLRLDPSSCTWSGEQMVVDAPSSETMTWSEGTCMRPAESTRIVNAPVAPIPPLPGNGVSVSADVSRNSDCTYDARWTVSRPVPKDTGWITWDSETVTQSGKMKYHHGYRAFFSQAEVPRPNRGSNVQINVHLNEFCLYDGQMSYSDLYAWEGGGGGGGGIRTRTTACYVSAEKAIDPKTLKPGYTGYVNWQMTEVRVFSGSGNEGSEQEFILDGGRLVSHTSAARAYSKSLSKKVLGVSPPRADAIEADIPEAEKEEIERAAQNNSN